MEINEKQIVKVQISLATSTDKQQVLVYNRKRNVLYQGDASQEIIKAMDGEPKKFFHANCPKGKMIELLEETPYKNW